MRLLRQTICLLIILANLLSVTTVFAEEISAEQISVPQPAVFSVTVPTSLPVSMDGRGNIYTSDSAAITNFSNDLVEVVDIDIVPSGNYTIVGYDESFAFKQIDSNQFAMKIKSSKTNSDGSFTFNNNEFGPIASGDTCSIPYQVKLTPSISAHSNIHLADVCITIDWYNKKTLTYNANGGVFASGLSTNPITFTSSGLRAGGQDEEPMRANCTFDGWFTDASLSTPFIQGEITEDVSAYARWLTTYKVIHSVQSLDHSYIYNTQEVETFTAHIGDVVSPEINYYDHYQQPTRQTMIIDGSGNCVITYVYDRTTFWVDVNFIIDGKESGGPSDADFPKDLTESFVNVFIDDVQVGWGQDFCQIHPWLAKYEIRLSLPERYYYVGPHLEGADYWDNGTTLYRCEDAGVITENIGARLIIKSAYDTTPYYTIHFDPNGGTGYTPTDMRMHFDNGEHEINWLNQQWLSKPGYYFAGWSLTPDGEVSFSDCARVTRLSDTNGDVVTLYAKWLPN